MDCMHPEKIIQKLVGLSVTGGYRVADTELYGFCFGLTDGTEVHNEYALHTLCEFKIVRRRPSIRVQIFSAQSSFQKFQNVARLLFGKTITRVALSGKNDLWLDFGGESWTIFVTDEDDSGEAWRLFKPNSGSAHLVATSSQLMYK